MNKPERIGGDTARVMQGLGEAARIAAARLAMADRTEKDAALMAAAGALRDATAIIIEANGLDIAAAESAGTSAAFIDRLRLDEQRIKGIAKGLEAIAGLDDPVGATIAEWRMPNKLNIERVRTPSE